MLISDQSDPDTPLAYAAVTDIFLADGDSRGKKYEGLLDRPIDLEVGKDYYIDLYPGTPDAQLRIYDVPTLKIQAGENILRQALPEAVDVLRAGSIFTNVFEAKSSGSLQKIFIPHILDWEANPGVKTVIASVWDRANEQPLAQSILANAFLPGDDYRGDGYWFTLDNPVES